MKYRKSALVVLCIVCMTTVVGCWSSLSIQNQHYVVTVGIDYEEEQYVIYAQILDFLTVARPEGGASSTESTVYIGKGIGSTLNEAAIDLYATAQAKIDWGQTKAIIVSAKALQHLGPKVVDRYYRFPENRYNTWFYVSDEPLSELLSIETFYNRTAMYSVLHFPNNSFRQIFVVPPLEMFKYMSSINEPDRVALIPMIGFDEEHWQKDKEAFKLPQNIGVFVRSTYSEYHFYDLEQIIGLRWLNKDLTRTPLLVEDEENIYALLVIHRSSFKIKPKIENGEVKFDIKAKYVGSMQEYIQELPYVEMMKLAKQIINNDIEKTYLSGVENDTDLFNFMNNFRLRYPNEWKKMTKEGTVFILNEQSIDSIEIDIRIPNTGKYKRIP